MRKTVLLVILDGWGLGQKDESNPIYVASPPNLKWLGENFPLTSLQAAGISVGLPWGEVGNSEVGHLTLGAGKVIYQYFPRITLAVRDGSFFNNPVFKAAFNHARKNSSSVNLIGLLTDGNIHASLEHLKALLKMAEKEGVAKLKLHLFADGKDSPPRSIEKFLNDVPIELLGSLIGRYYAMDREDNWQLIERAYLAMIGEGGELVDDTQKILKEALSQGSSEEFLPPYRFTGGKNIEDNDSLIFFNFREDGVKELSSVFTHKDFSKFQTKKLKNLYVVTMTRYEEKSAVPAAFEPEAIEKPLGWALSEAGKNQIRIAETYKYAHVTYFFNGYREPPFKNEYRVLIPSVSTPHPEKHPEMMAPSVTDRILQGLENQSFDFILANYANPDVIAHTGNYEAALAVVKVIDEEIGRLLKVASGPNTTIIFTADHGNLEQVLNPLTSRAETQHDPHPVPFYLVSEEFRGRKFPNQENLGNETAGIISDVAPTILELMEIQKPREMTGESLLRKLL